MDIEGVRLPFVPAGGVGSLKSPTQPVKVPGGKNTDFQDIFQKELEKVNFSSHAQSRMVSRDINISPPELEKLELAIDKLAAKGGKDSLVMMQDKSFIVNVPSKTIVTVFDSSQMQDNVFTNIDSAVMA